MANETSTKKDNQQPPKGFPVVAIGASAGGLEAVKELFENERSWGTRIVLLRRNVQSLNQSGHV